jgi:hypothetical protein
VRFLTKLTNMILPGSAPGSQLLRASTLIPLRKAGMKKVRPIAIGEHFYRIPAKVIARNYRRSGDLHPHQLGVATSGGVEPLIWNIHNRTQEESEGAFIFLDLSNAFNTLDREHVATAIRTHNTPLFRCGRWAYGSPSPLFVKTPGGDMESLLHSRQGVRQGDPMGPLFFFYGFHDRIALLSDSLMILNAEVYTYLDDTIIWVPYDNRNPTTMFEQAQSAFQLISTDFARFRNDGLTLNIAKCRTLLLSGIRHSGVEFLGICVGPVKTRTRFLQQKIAEMHRKSRLVLKLPRQSALLLIRDCVSSPLLHLLRTLDSTNLDGTWSQASDIIY